MNSAKVAASTRRIRRHMVKFRFQDLAHFLRQVIRLYAGKNDYDRSCCSIDGKCIVTD